MRAVDTTAEKTGRACRATYVVSAESGAGQKCARRSRVCTRSATPPTAAEQVIRTPGQRVTKEIGAILDVIDDVGDETTLLALNAAIIAAQAGEHGRAFSVVADEIKELADRVLASTKEIGTLIRAVQARGGERGRRRRGSARTASQVASSSGGRSGPLARGDHPRGARERHAHRARSSRRCASRRKAVHTSSSADGARERSGVQRDPAEAGAEQDRGNEVVYRSAVTMREVTQQVRRTTAGAERGLRADPRERRGRSRGCGADQRLAPGAVPGLQPDCGVPRGSGGTNSVERTVGHEHGRGDPGPRQSGGGAARRRSEVPDLGRRRPVRRE